MTQFGELSLAVRSIDKRKKLAIVRAAMSDRVVLEITSETTDGGTRRSDVIGQIELDVRSLMSFAHGVVDGFL